DPVSIQRTVRETYTTWREAIARRDALLADARRRAERIELLTFQAKEIDETAPKPGELDAVDARHKLLSQIDHGRSAASASCSALTEGEDALVDHLARIAQRVADLTAADPAAGPMAESLRSAAVLAREAARDLMAHVETLDADPGELAKLD